MIKYLVILSAFSMLGACEQQTDSSYDQEGTLDQEAIATIFDQMKRLKGTWEGEYEWTGAMNAKGFLTANYQLIGREFAISEQLLNQDGDLTMSSVYHLDGPGSLRMSHFCTNNQPRLKATEIDDAYVKFGMIDITNLTSTHSWGHVYQVELKFINSDSLHLTFGYRQEGDVLSQELARLKRISKEAY